MLSKYISVFNNDAGLLKDHLQHISLRENTNPIFKKARHPPFALRNKIEDELNRLVQTNIIEKVDHSEWATPIVPVLKSDSTLRICGDYKVTVNQVIAKDEHPIPRIDELANKLAHGKSGCDNDQYSLRTIPLQTTSLWNIIMSCHFSAYHRVCIQGHS